MARELINVKERRGTHFSVYYDAADNTWDAQTMMIVVLSDIRDELQTLNQLLGCRNFVEVPKVLRDIRDNTTKRRRPRTVKP